MEVSWEPYVEELSTDWRLNLTEVGTTVFIPISAQGACINHFGLTFICFNIFAYFNYQP